MIRKGILVVVASLLVLGQSGGSGCGACANGNIITGQNHFGADTRWGTAGVQNSNGAYRQPGYLSTSSSDRNEGSWTSSSSIPSVISSVSNVALGTGMSSGIHTHASTPSRFFPNYPINAIGIGNSGSNWESNIVLPTGTTQYFGAVSLLGPQSPQSPQGPAGLPGLNGATGEAGDSGPSGPAGPAGPTGETGPMGPEGPAGPAGPSGEVGPAGP